MKSDLTIYNLLTIIRNLAHNSLVDDTPEWRIKREEALRKIKDLASGALEKGKINRDMSVELLEALSELVVHLELAPDWDADTLPLLIQDAGEVIEKARKELGIK